VILSDLAVDPADFTARTGWHLEPRGACKADLCVPLPATAETDDGALDVRVVADTLGMSLVHDAAHQIWALGPETRVTGRALSTATAPELELPNVDGSPFRLSSLLGQKVLLVAWASW
jgi:hypothetical protein